MSSILTNNGAMVALQTLQSINKNLGQTQTEISTGKSIANAKDNSAIWAISKVMESDVQGFKAVSDSLNLGQSTVSVARAAAEKVTEDLIQMKDKIVAAQGSNVDRGKLNDEVQAFVESIRSTVGAAQFNGLNLVDGKIDGSSVIGSLNRAADGSVSTSTIDIAAQNLSDAEGLDIAPTTDPVTAQAPVGTPGDPGVPNTTYALAAANGAANDFDEIELDFGDQFLQAGGAAAGAVALGKDTAGVDPTLATGFLAGDVVTLTIGNTEGSYTIREGDTADAMNAGLKRALEDGGLDSNNFSITLGAGTLTVANLTNQGNIGVEYSSTRGNGGLADLTGLDVSTEAGAASAIASIEKMIDTSISAAASFGSDQKRIDSQADFLSKLTDAFKSGIGSLVDANMEEASARLQALQVQQQLATQSLSIANQAPQSILSLFR